MMKCSRGIQSSLSGHKNTLCPIVAAVKFIQKQPPDRVVGDYGPAPDPDLCPFCKRPWPIAERVWQLEPPSQIFHVVGCSECRRTGYRGRNALFEIMVMSPELVELVDSKVNIETLRRRGEIVSHRRFFYRWYVVLLMVYGTV